MKTIILTLSLIVCMFVVPAKRQPAFGGKRTGPQIHTPAPLPPKLRPLHNWYNQA
jgi:hypothetical protein